MAKTNFSKGDCVKGKKWSGAEIKGVYEYTYDDGSHCVLDVTNGKRFNIKPKDLELASEDEAKEIKKLQKEKHLKLHDKADSMSVVKDLVKDEEETKEELDIALAGDETEELAETESLDVEGTELD
jgi:hypothetical protein